MFNDYYNDRTNNLFDINAEQIRKVKTNIINPIPDSYIHNSIHDWIIFSKDKEAIVITKCNLFSKDQTIKTRCMICNHL